jgi:hypothetical protein
VKKSVFIYFIAGVSILLTTNCTNSNNTSNKTDSSLLDVKVGKDVSNTFESTLSAASPEEVMTLFEDSEFVYKSNLLNKVANKSNYLTSKALSYNLGVYVMDAAYLNMFNQYSEMTNYLEIIFDITDALEINGIYSEFDFKKVFKEMDNPDSLIVLSEGIFNAVTNYMIENNNEPMLCLISTGSFVELLYLTLESVGKFTADDVVIQHIYDQKMQLDNLYEFSQAYIDNSEMEEMIGYLSQLVEIWNKVEFTQEETTVSKNQDGKLIIGGSTKPDFSEDQFLELKKTIKEIRTKITT